MLVNKITVGFVTQVFDTETNQFVSQDFTAGDEVDYEDQDGECVDGDEVGYLPFEMNQPNDSDAVAEKIYQGLHKQAFVDWHGDDGNFGDHIAHYTLDPPKKEQIIEEIKKMFNL